MRLTEALILKSPQVTNTLDERELDLRGVGLQKMDEVVLSKIADDFDCLNLCDNQIATLDSFPQMDRLTSLILHKNSLLTTVVSGVTVRTPNVHTFVANACGFATLTSLNFLAGWPLLERVSFTRCPLYQSVADFLFNSATKGALPEKLKGLSAIQVIRLYVIVVCSTGQFTASVSSSFRSCPLKLIDFDRVLDVERTQAKELKNELLQLPALIAAASGTNATSLTTSVASSGPVFAADGTRIRKRGREAAAGYVATPPPQGALAADGSGATVAIIGGEAPSAAADAAALLADDITEEQLKKRQEGLIARIETAETEEDFRLLELEEQELDRLRNLLEARKAKKSRGERR